MKGRKEGVGRWVELYYKVVKNCGFLLQGNRNAYRRTLSLILLLALGFLLWIVALKIKYCGEIEWYTTSTYDHDFQRAETRKQQERL